MGVLYAFIADVFIFDESISTFELLGALLILSVTVWVSVVKIRENSKAREQEKQKEV